MDSAPSSTIDYRERYEAIRKIVTTTHWDSPHRITYATLQIAAWERADSIGNPDRVTFTDMTAKRAAALTGLKPDKVGDVLKTLADYEVIGRKVDPPVWKGDHYETPTWVTVETTPPDVLPDLPKSDKLIKAKERTDARMEVLKAWADEGQRLSKLVCPECGATGDWHLTCGECGFTVTPAEMTTGQRVNDIPESWSWPGPADDQAGPAQRNSLTACFPALHEEGPSNLAAPERELPGSFLNGEIPEPESTDSRPPISAESRANLLSEVMTSAQTIDYLDGLGAEFCFVESHGKKPINPRNGEGDELPWPDAPVSAEAAKSWLSHKGNVGLLTGRGHMALIDVDSDLAGFIARYPMMGVLPRVTRATASDRAKLLVFIEGDCPTWHSPKGAVHKIDLLGVGAQGVVAGIHESAADIQFTPGDLVKFSWPRLIKLAREWSGAPAATRSAPDPNATITPPSEYGPTEATRTDSRGLPYGEQVKSAIAWWNDRAANRAEVDRLLAKCKRVGAHVAIRPDDTHPSTIASKTTAPDGRRTWHDYGPGQTLDDFEMFVALSGKEKRAFIYETVEAWRAEVGA